VQHLVNGDCYEVLRGMKESCVDSTITDPPYELGFMGKAWDRSGIAYRVELWVEILRVLKPGGHLLAFGGSRTYHRLACAVEDAGFEIRDQIQWIYGSGFPKSLDVSKAIDKAAGAKREVVGSKIGLPGYSLKHSGAGCVLAGRADGSLDNAENECSITAPATDAARQWAGWGTALKPAHEPIVVARKPLIGTVAENVQAHGTGAMNIDGCRIETDDGLNGGAYAKNPTLRDELWGEKAGNSWKRGGAGGYIAPSGRWPANIIHDGDGEVTETFPNNEARFFYCAKANKTDRGEGNNHPTVKPTDLMRYLCRLVTPPGGVILDPFMGSGSTGKAAVAEGFHFVGIEKDQKYYEIAKARVNAD
jgi:DNA modification methylase